jgi:outer membrane protein assembly factor BamB
LAAVSLACARAEKTAMRFEAGVWDPDLHAVFVATERPADARGQAPDLAASVEAIDLASGKLLWTAPCSGLPIAVIDRRVVATRWVRGSRSFSVCLIDGDNGEIVGRHNLPLPSWTDLPGANVTVDAARGPDNRLIVGWRGKSSYAGGAPPPPAIEAEHTHDESGAYAIDPENDSFDAATPPSPAEARPSLSDDTIRLPAGIAYLPGERPAAFTGETLLTLQAEPIASPAAAGSTSLFLIARAPATGSILWRRHIRDVIWRPPPPPQP